MEDVDFLRRTLAVSRQVQRNDGGGVEIRPPKYGSERVVYLPDGLVQLLARHVQQHRPGSDPARWLFEGAPDDPPHQNTVGYWWRKAQATAGITGVKLHDLRHYFASGLKMRGVASDATFDGFCDGVATRTWGFRLAGVVA